MISVNSDCGRFILYDNGTAYDLQKKRYVTISMTHGQAKYARFSVPITINTYTNRVVHRLIAKAFIENPNNLNEVNHKDLNKNNNSYSNLEWVTHKENQQHYFNSDAGKKHQSKIGKLNKGITGTYGDCPICNIKRPMKGLDLHVEACRKKNGINVSWKLLNSLPLGLKTLRRKWELFLSAEKT